MCTVNSLFYEQCRQFVWRGSKKAKKQRASFMYGSKMRLRPWMSGRKTGPDPLVQHYFSLLVIFRTKLKNHLYSEWCTVTTHPGRTRGIWNLCNDILFDTKWNTNKWMKWIENAIWSSLAYMRTVQINWKDKTYYSCTYTAQHVG